MPGVRFTIRQARVSDAPALAAAERAIAATPGALASRPHELRDENFAAKIAELAAADNGRYLVAATDDEPIGHAVFDPLRLDATRHVVHLTLAVHPGWQRQGVGAALQIDRMYHSTAILLPDGRVLSAGGGKRTADVVDHHNAEFYSPPYLFSETERPEISDFPEEVDYATKFDVVISTPGASDVDRVTLIRLGSVTHQFDMDQRFLELDFAIRAEDTLRVVSPATRDEAPPGYYMLFVLDNGVPSIGRYIKLQ